MALWERGIWFSNRKSRSQVLWSYRSKKLQRTKNSSHGRNRWPGSWSSLPSESCTKSRTPVHSESLVSHTVFDEVFIFPALGEQAATLSVRLGHVPFVVHHVGKVEQIRALQDLCVDSPLNTNEPKALPLLGLFQNQNRRLV